MSPLDPRDRLLGRIMDALRRQGLERSVTTIGWTQDAFAMVVVVNGVRTLLELADFARFVKLKDRSLLKRLGVA